jgi:hypothetical protein
MRSGVPECAGLYLYDSGNLSTMLLVLSAIFSPNRMITPTFPCLIRSNMWGWLNSGIKEITWCPTSTGRSCSVAKEVVRDTWRREERICEAIIQRIVKLHMSIRIRSFRNNSDNLSPKIPSLFVQVSGTRVMIFLAGPLSRRGTNFCPP